MENNSEKRRGWIKNIAIIFLSILLLLTFFSNTILNYSLPEVSAQYAEYGTITSSVKASGTVKANESYNVVYEEDEADEGMTQSRKVLSVYVKEGDYVEKDQEIISLKGGASTQLESLRTEYATLKKQYDLDVLQDGVDALTSDKSISDAKKEISDAKEELEQLKKEYTAALNGTDESTVIEEYIETLNDKLDSIDEAITAVNEKISDTQSLISQAEGIIETDILDTQSVSEKLAAAEAEYNAKLALFEAAQNAVSEAKTVVEEAKNVVEEAKKYLEEIQATSENVEKANTLTNEINTLEESLAETEKSLQREEEDYIDDVESLINSTLNAEDEGESSIAQELKSKLSNVNKNRYVRVVDNFIKENDKSSDFVTQLASKAKTFNRSVESYEEKIEDIESEIADARAKLAVIDMPQVDDVIDYAVNYDLSMAQTQCDDAEKSQTEAEAALTEAEAALTEAEAAYNTAKSEYDSLLRQNQAEGLAAQYTAVLTQYENELAGYKAQRKEVEKQITEQNKKLSNVEAPADPEEIEKQIKEKEESIANLESQLTITEASQKKSDTSVSLEREEQENELAELEAKIAAYENAPETTSVVAPIAGRIVSINVVPGDTVTSGNSVASIEIADKGYVVEISMSSDEARKIQVGSPCTVSNSWWYSDIEASVTQVRSDAQSQGKNRIVTIEVTGDVYEGQSLSFSIGEKNQSYDTVLPNSAIREDSDGKYVLVVESKKTPLGMRYTARRTEIQITASDDTKSAVSGLYGSEFVITNSTTPISDNQQVRLADE